MAQYFHSIDPRKLLSARFDKSYFISYITGKRMPTNSPRYKRSSAKPMAEINEAEVMDALRECYDPEIPVNIVDLGLIYGLGIENETGEVNVTVTLTAMGCPMPGGVVSQIVVRFAEAVEVNNYNG